MGEVSVTLVDRGCVRADRNHVVDGYAVASPDDPDPDHGIDEFVVWSAVIEAPETTYLWDAGSHPDAGDGYWPDPLYAAFEHVDAHEHDLETDLDRVGYALSDVDAVVASHLHLNHAGGLYQFAGTDTPVYVHEDELKLAHHSAKTTGGRSRTSPATPTAT